ncbi:hypothetical protein HKX48_008372 [Thoreauomyces humboldtii]|nr:hypothetical protein HKX48_008372 [Thoreauomyces humboldtii]
MKISVEDVACYLDFARDDPRLVPIPEPPRPTPEPNVMFQPDAFQYAEGNQHPARPAHVPKHLPPFPNPHSFIHNTLSPETAIPASQLRAKQADQSRQVEDNLTEFLTKTNQIIHRQSRRTVPTPAMPTPANRPKQRRYSVSRPPDKVQISFHMEEDEDLLPVNYEQGWRRRRKVPVT